MAGLAVLTLAGMAGWIAVLQVEERSLLGSLRATEEILNAERREAEEADERIQQELKQLRERHVVERQELLERHEATVRTMVAEALGAQWRLVVNGCKPSASSR